MDEHVVASSEFAGNDSGQEANNQQSTPVSNDSVTSHQQPEEKFVKQSVVDNVVARTKQEALERGQRIEREKWERSTSQSHNSTASSQTTHTLPAEDIERIAQSAVQKQLGDIALANDVQRRNAWAHEQGQQFAQKFESAKESYSDFDEVVAPIRNDLMDKNSVLAALVPHFNGVENMSDIMYELGKNPQKIGSLLSVSGSPALMKQALQTMSNSIKMNKDAANRKSPNAPLSHIKPSNTGIDNGGNNTISNARKKYTF